MKQGPHLYPPETRWPVPVAHDQKQDLWSDSPHPPPCTDRHSRIQQIPKPVPVNLNRADSVVKCGSAQIPAQHFFGAFIRFGCKIRIRIAIRWLCIQNRQVQKKYEKQQWQEVCRNSFHNRWYRYFFRQNANWSVALHFYSTK